MRQIVTGTNLATATTTWGFGWFSQLSMVDGCPLLNRETSCSLVFCQRQKALDSTAAGKRQHDSAAHGGGGVFKLSVFSCQPSVIG